MSDEMHCNNGEWDRGKAGREKLVAVSFSRSQSEKSVRSSIKNIESVPPVDLYCLIDPFEIGLKVYTILTCLINAVKLRQLI